ncbi:MAG TPA: nucleotidyltransferase family protein [Magnetospirillaceae bacterium]|nr:nucleotidyltransferase family protein [Magnetospirillaceae bacterium]
MPGKAVALILAAGRGTRFGSDKRRAAGPWEGPLLHHVLALYRPLFTTLGVVTGSDDAFGEEACRRFSAYQAINPDAAQGMGTSLAKGAAWLIGEGADCAVIGLADMPWIRPETIAAVTEEGLRTGRAVAPSFEGTPGFPRAVPASLFPDLLKLTGDRGAAAIIDWRLAVWLDCADPGILRDIDEPQDIPGKEIS